MTGGDTPNRPCNPMMLFFDQAAEALDKMAEEFPEPLFDGLSGGVNLLPDVQTDPELPDVYILGEYCDDLLGRYINLYYGSFAALAEREDWTQAQWNDELRTTLSHELTHHMSPSRTGTPPCSSSTTRSPAGLETSMT